MERIERALSAVRSGDLTEAGARLTNARAVLNGLDPNTLEPRRGLAGLFDRRGGRLKRFRDQWRQAARRNFGVRVRTISREKRAKIGCSHVAHCARYPFVCGVCAAVDCAGALAAT